MKRSQFTDQEILHLLSEAKAGVPVAEICRTSCVSVRTFYRWRQRFGGLTPQAVRQMKDLQAENRRLRALVASLNAKLHADGEAQSRAAPQAISTRRDFGSSDATSRLLAARPRDGVALGRFASVRAGR
jgi:putative transposase